MGALAVLCTPRVTDQRSVENASYQCPQWQRLALLNHGESSACPRRSSNAAPMTGVKSFIKK